MGQPADPVELARFKGNLSERNWAMLFVSSLFDALLNQFGSLTDGASCLATTPAAPPAQPIAYQ
jgi:hypothetical protein